MLLLQIFFLPIVVAITTLLPPIISTNQSNESAAGTNLLSSSALANGKPSAWSCPTNAIRLQNWGGSFTFGTQNIQYPRSVAHVQQIVRGARRLRVIGAGHSFSQIANSPDTLLSILGLNSIVSFNASVPSVTVQAGITYAELIPSLFLRGFALPMLVAFSELTVGGATQTGAHGRGLGSGSMAAQVRSVQLVLANGSVATYGPGQPEVKAMACGLGAFGVITQLELGLMPTFNVTNYAFLNMPSTAFYANFEAIQNMGYFVQCRHDLSNQNNWRQILIKARTGKENDALKNLTSLFGATRDFVPSVPSVTPLNVELPWYQGLLNTPIGMTPKDGDQIQSEYFVPYANATAALKAVENLLPILPPVATSFGCRTIAGDDLWMSQFNGNGPKLAIQVNWRNNATAVAPLLAKVEAALEPFGARPHWAKHFTMSPKKFLRPSIYPKLGEFKKLAEKLDPTHKFRNAFLEQNVFAYNI